MWKKSAHFFGYNDIKSDSEPNQIIVDPCNGNCLSWLQITVLINYYHIMEVL